MNSSKPRKAKRSTSPSSQNPHSHMSSHKPGKGKHLKVNEEIYKTPGLLNVSKASRSSSKGMAKSRSTNVLPPIIGNDLKKIKEIFTKAKHYRDKMNHQNIQVKSFPKAGKGSPTKPPRTQSIPKMKNSSSSLKYPTYNIGTCGSVRKWLGQ